MPKRRRVGIVVALVCGSAGVAGAQPAESPITLWWEVPPGAECPSSDAVSAEVERLLGGKPNASSGRRLFARAQVAREERDGTWKLRLRTVIAAAGDEADGERILHAPSCEGLAGAAALIVALGFDAAAVVAQAERTGVSPPSPPAEPGNAPAATAALPPPEQSAPPPPPEQPAAQAPSEQSAAPPFPEQSAAPLPTASPAAPASAVPPAPPPPAVSSPAAPPPVPPSTQRPAWNGARLRGAMGLGAGADAGTFAAPAYSLHLWGTLRYRRLELAASAAFYPPHRTAVPERPEVGGMFMLLTGGLSACYRLVAFRADSLGLAACAGAEAGQMRAQGYGVRSPGAADALWIAPRAGGAFTAALSDMVGLRLDAGVVVPVTRSRFVLERVGVVHEPAVVAGRADAGVELHF